MSIEFSTEADPSGNSGFYIHVPASNPALIEHIYRFGDVDLCNSISHYCQTNGLPDPAPVPEPVKEPVVEPEIEADKPKAPKTHATHATPKPHKK